MPVWGLMPGHSICRSLGCCRLESCLGLTVACSVHALLLRHESRLGVGLRILYTLLMSILTMLLRCRRLVARGEDGLLVVLLRGWAPLGLLCTLLLLLGGIALGRMWCARVRCRLPHAILRLSERALRAHMHVHLWGSAISGSCSGRLLVVDGLGLSGMALHCSLLRVGTAV